MSDGAVLCRWENVQQIRSLRQMTQRTLMQFTPHDWTHVEWCV